MPNTDLLIRLKAQTDGLYPVEAIVDGGDGGHYTGGQMRVAVADFVPLALDSEKYGKKLFEALFAGEIRRAYDKAVAQVEADPASHLRVRVWIDANAPELHALNWERLYHQYRGSVTPLAVSAGTPLSRYTPLEAPIPPAVVERPIGLFVSVANPSDLPPDLKPALVEEEIETLRQAVSGNPNWKISLLAGRTGLPEAVKTQLHAEGWELLDGATTLANIARGVQDAHVWHFIGHGSFNRQTRNGLLHLEKDDGTRQAAPDVDVVQKLSGARNLRLIFMVACQSAERPTDIEHPFIGVAPKLVQSGVPAIVAMQDYVPIEFARSLTGDFYKRLLAHGKVDEALSEARNTLFGRKSAAWAIPVLFMRLRGGQLFASTAAERDAENEAEQTVAQQITNIVNTINQTGNNNVAVQGNDNVVNVDNSTNFNSAGDTNFSGDFVRGSSIQNTFAGPVTFGSPGASAEPVQRPPDSGGGGVTFKTVGGNVNIGGDIIKGDKVIAGGAEDKTWAIFRKQMDKARTQIAGLGLAEGDKDDAIDAATKIEGEIVKAEPDIRRLERSVKGLVEISPQAYQAVLKAVTNIAAKVPDNLQASIKKYQP